MSKELENATELAERSTKIVNTRDTVIIDDGTNQVKIPGYPYRFRSREDKILVSVDIYKSGYECKECKGEGKIHTHCACEDTDRPGYRYNKSQIADAHASLGEKIAEERMEILCPSCKGDFISFRRAVDCEDCKGKGASIYIPDESKTLPTTGVIVSIGAKVPKEDGYYIGQRVLFGAYVGVMIPTKVPGIVFKSLRCLEILCDIEGGEELASFDFLTIDKAL